jgi:trehalose 6-phosphate phosphatase
MSRSAARLPLPPAISPDWALFLDVDGTLLDFAPTPDSVRVPSGLVATLDILRAHLDGALALVSGRSLATLDALFAPLQLPAVGLHGLERRSADPRTMPPSPPALDAFRAQAEALAAQHPGALVEDKGTAVALHWRGNPAAATALLVLAETALAELPGYQLQPGDHVLELRPRGADKGSAILAMLDAPPFHGRLPVFVGDDHTDEHGFAAVREHCGIAVLVGDRQPSAARHRLPDTAAVRAWLTDAAIRLHRAPRKGTMA